MPANFVISSRHRCGGPPPHGTSETASVEIPCVGNVLRVHELHGRQNELDSVPVRVAEIDKDALGRAVPSRPVFHLAAVAEVAGDVCGPDHGLQVGDDEGHVVQARAGGPSEHQIVRIVFARQERRRG